MSSKKIVKITLPFLIIGMGFLVARALMAVAPQAGRKQGDAEPMTVEVFEARLGRARVRVQATGTVEAAEVVDVVPEVAGRIVWRAKQLLPGGRFGKDETLARIDAREYALAVEQERAQVRAAALEVELEQGRGKVAAREWELLKGDGAPKKSPLVLRRSQLETTQANLAGAKSGLARAKLNLERTTLRAPFNATVVTESVAIGQRVGPTGPVAQLVGTDEFWVRVGVRVEALRDIEIPGLNAESEGSPARITQRMSDGSTIVRNGRVIRLVEKLDPQTRRAQVLISIPQPLVPGGDGLPLLPGAYVEVEIVGTEVSNVASVPRNAVYDGQRVWTVNDGALKPVQVAVRFAQDDEVFVSGALEDGTMVVVTPLATPVEGARVDPQAVAVAVED